MPLRLLMTPIIIVAGILSTIDWVIRGNRSRMSKFNRVMMDFSYNVE